MTLCCVESIFRSSHSIKGSICSPHRVSWAPELHHYLAGEHDHQFPAYRPLVVLQLSPVTDPLPHLEHYNIKSKPAWTVYESIDWKQPKGCCYDELSSLTRTLSHHNHCAITDRLCISWSPVSSAYTALLWQPTSLCCTHVYIFCYILDMISKNANVNVYLYLSHINIWFMLTYIYFLLF